MRQQNCENTCGDQWEAIMQFQAENKGKCKIKLCKFLLQSVCLSSFFLIAGIKFHVQDIGQQSVKPSGLLPRKVRNITDDGSKKHAITSTS